MKTQITALTFVAVSTISAVSLPAFAWNLLPNGSSNSGNSNNGLVQDFINAQPQMQGQRLLQNMQRQSDEATQDMINQGNEATQQRILMQQQQMYDQGQRALSNLQRQLMYGY